MKKQLKKGDKIAYICVSRSIDSGLTSEPVHITVYKGLTVKAGGEEVFRVHNAADYGMSSNTDQFMVGRATIRGCIVPNDNPKTIEVYLERVREELSKHAAMRMKLLQEVVEQYAEFLANESPIKVHYMG